MTTLHMWAIRPADPDVRAELPPASIDGERAPADYLNAYSSTGALLRSDELEAACLYPTRRPEPEVLEVEIDLDTAVLPVGIDPFLAGRILEITATHNLDQFLAEMSDADRSFHRDFPELVEHAGAPRGARRALAVAHGDSGVTTVTPAAARRRQSWPNPSVERSECANNQGAGGPRWERCPPKRGAR